MKTPLINQYFITEPVTLTRIKSTKLNEIAQNLEKNASNSTKKTDKTINSHLSFKSPSTSLHAQSSTFMIDASSLNKQRSKAIQTPRNSPTLSRSNSVLIREPHVSSLQIRREKSFMVKNVDETGQNTPNTIFKPKLPNFNRRTSLRRKQNAESKVPSEFKYYHSSVLKRILTIKSDQMSLDTLDKRKLKKSSDGVAVYNLLPTLMPKRNKSPSRKFNYSQDLIEDPNTGYFYRPYSMCSTPDHIDYQDLSLSATLVQMTPIQQQQQQLQRDAKSNSYTQFSKYKEISSKALRAADVVKSQIPNYLDVYRFL